MCFPCKRIKKYRKPLKLENPEERYLATAKGEIGTLTASCKTICLAGNSWWGYCTTESAPSPQIRLK